MLWQAFHIKYLTEFGILRFYRAFQWWSVWLPREDSPDLLLFLSISKWYAEPTENNLVLDYSQKILSEALNWLREMLEMMVAFWAKEFDELDSYSIPSWFHRQVCILYLPFVVYWQLIKPVTWRDGQPFVTLDFDRLSIPTLQHIPSQIRKNELTKLLHKMRVQYRV